MFKFGSFVVSMAFVIGLFAIPSLVSSQETYEKRENVEYYRAIHLNFKPGHNEAAWAILYEKFQPASEAAGNRFVAVDWETGEWDTTVYIHMKDGYGVMEYANSPGNAAFRAALVESEGSEEAADAVFEEWNSHIDNADTDIGHMHMQPEDEGEGEDEDDEAEE